MLDPDRREHRDTRSLLRVVGPLVVGAGALFLIVAMVDFFAAFGTMRAPRLFWCAFVGIPLLAFGSVICKFAFMGSVIRYMADEVAPVGKDTANYLANGTQDAVRTVFRAASSGLREGMGGATTDRAVKCPACQADNDADAAFCKSCGAPLARACPRCGERNDPDARFCDHCGNKLA